MLLAPSTASPVHTTRIRMAQLDHVLVLMQVVLPPAVHSTSAPASPTYPVGRRIGSLLAALTTTTRVAMQASSSVRQTPTAQSTASPAPMTHLHTAQQVRVPVLMQVVRQPAVRWISVPASPTYPAVPPTGCLLAAPTTTTRAVTQRS